MIFQFRCLYLTKFSTIDDRQEVKKKIFLRLPSGERTKRKIFLKSPSGERTKSKFFSNRRVEIEKNIIVSEIC